MKLLPEHVTMIRHRGKYAALRLQPFSAPALQTMPDGPWETLDVVGATRRLPWRVRLQLSDGRALAFAACATDEADLGTVGQGTPGGGSTPLGDDPISAIIAVFVLLFHLVMLPYYLTVLWSRSQVAKAVRRQILWSDAGAVALSA